MELMVDITISGGIWRAARRALAIVWPLFALVELAAAWLDTGVPIPKFAKARSTLRVNFGIKATLAILGF